jgi:hypothetical protein
VVSTKSAPGRLGLQRQWGARHRLYHGQADPYPDRQRHKLGQVDRDTGGGVLVLDGQLSVQAGYHSEVDPALASWLITGALGPALVALPVNWSAERLAGLARRWLDRIRREDGLSRLVLAADPLVCLTGSELAAVRRLLEEPGTWRLIGGGTVEELAGMISKCLLEAQDAEGDPAMAGRAIARGLVEFAVFNLEPELFQRVLMARISRVEARQAERLDQAILQLHADLAAWLACQSQADELRNRRIFAQLGLVLDRLPPGPAGPDDVCFYLATLIRWLSQDPWPQDPRLGGSALAPARIERKLAISGGGGVGERDRDADDAASRCTRLVVLGGAGSGKTWLARRTARRCAEAALEALVGGDAGLDDVELPLFTVCSLLSTERGDIRSAVVSSALAQLGDLGGSRITDALRLFFTERNFPTLLVIDSLDEARHADERLRQADTLPPPWRIVLTSRPSSWKQQLAIVDGDPSHLVGSLRPLLYPDDVEPFIDRWFAAAPAAGDALIAEIKGRADLQQAATVPLILAFYCIIGAEAPLPNTKHEVYASVLWHLLSGLWRNAGSEDADSSSRLAILRCWAWDAATEDATTGIGTWADEVLTPYVQISEPDRAAVDHVATPVRLPSLATGATYRRFIHRSMREYLTAEHVATKMSAAAAATELLNHLWYDSDWEYAAPAALAMHPERDQVLKELICRAAPPGLAPGDLAGIDGCWEVRRFLSQVAAETSEASWATQSAAIITQARLDFASNGPNSLLRLPAAPGWPTSNGQIRRGLLDQLDVASAGSDAVQLALALAGLGPEPGELARARARVLDLLEGAGSGYHAGWLAKALAGLGPEPGELARARGRVLDLMDALDLPWEAGSLAEALPELSSEPADLARARERAADLLDVMDVADPEWEGWKAGLLAEAVTLLDPEPRDLARARGRVLDMMNAVDLADVFGDDIGSLAGALGRLRPEPGDLGRARGRVLDLMDAADDGWDARELAEALVRLGPEPSELARARERIVDMLDAAEPAPQAGDLAKALAALDPEPDDLAWARGRMLDLLDAADPGSNVGFLAKVVAGLGPEPGDLARARGRVLDLLDATDGRSDARQLAEALAGLGPEPDDLARARGRVLDLLDGARLGGGASGLPGALAVLGPVAGDLASWASWAAAPGSDLLAAARRNTPLRSWLEILPMLPSLSA